MHNDTKIRQSNQSLILIIFLFYNIHYEHVLFVRDTENVFFFDFHDNGFTETRSYTETFASVGEIRSEIKQKRPTKIEDWMLQCDYVESVIQGQLEN